MCGPLSKCPVLFAIILSKALWNWSCSLENFISTEWNRSASEAKLISVLLPAWWPIAAAPWILIRPYSAPSSPWLFLLELSLGWFNLSLVAGFKSSTLWIVLSLHIGNFERRMQVRLRWSCTGRNVLVPQISTFDFILSFIVIFRGNSGSGGPGRTRFSLIVSYQRCEIRLDHWAEAESYQ